MIKFIYSNQYCYGLPYWCNLCLVIQTGELTEELDINLTDPIMTPLGRLRVLVQPVKKTEPWKVAKNGGNVGVITRRISFVEGATSNDNPILDIQNVNLTYPNFS